MANRKKSRSSKKKKLKYILSITIIALIFVGGLIFYNLVIKNDLLGFSDTPIENSDTKDTSSNNDPIKTEEIQKPYSSDNKPTPPENTSTEVLLTTVGDCTLGRDEKYSYEGSLPQVLEKNNNDFSYIFKNVYSIFNSDDITIANLEGTFTNSKVKADKQFTFKAPPEYAKILTSGSVEGVNLSNNHTMDYLKQGFEDTKTALISEEIEYFGEGNVWVTEVKGVKFGFLGYKGFYNSKELQDKMKSDILNLKKQNCIVIINFHWGEEGKYTPNSVQKSIAHFAIDNGADLIIGHHPHVVQGLEKYKNKLIFYSLGNFAFGGNRNPSDKDTLIAQVKFNFENSTLSSYDFKVIPAKLSSVNYTNDYSPIVAEGNSKAAILDKLNKISPNLGLKIDGTFQNIPLSNKEPLK